MSSPGLLGDTAARDYTRKLQLFNRCAEPELRRAIAGLGLRSGQSVLDAGCGSGEALRWLTEAVAPGGRVVGLDLATAHVTAARKVVPLGTLVLQGDLTRAPLPKAQFDLIWCVNTINHVRDPGGTVRSMTQLLRPDGRIVLGQSNFLPEMVFAWDARLERLTNEAVRCYYRERYGLEERDLTAIRALVGVLRGEGLHHVTAHTLTIERLSPLCSADRQYLLEAIFQATWGERLRPYLSGEDYAQLQRLCDPDSAEFALDRPDFHFIQSFTVVLGSVGA